MHRGDQRPQILGCRLTRQPIQTLGQDTRRACLWAQKQIVLPRTGAQITTQASSTTASRCGVGKRQPVGSAPLVIRRREMAGDIVAKRRLVWLGVRPSPVSSNSFAISGVEGSTEFCSATDRQSASSHSRARGRRRIGRDSRSAPIHLKFYSIRIKATYWPKKCHARHEGISNKSSDPHNGWWAEV